MVKIRGVTHNYSDIHAMFKEIDTIVKRANGKPITIGIESVLSEYQDAVRSKRNIVSYWKDIIDYAKTYPNVRIAFIDSKLGRDYAEKAFKPKKPLSPEEKKRALVVADFLRSKTIANRIAKQHVDLAIIGANHAIEVEQILKRRAKYVKTNRTEVSRNLERFRRKAGILRIINQRKKRLAKRP